MHAAGGPLIIQGDDCVLLDARHPDAGAAREQLARFAEPVKRPGDLHTYRITPLSVWNAVASGLTAEEMADVLIAWSRYDVSARLLERIGVWAGRYGKITLEADGDGEESLVLTVDGGIAEELCGLGLLPGRGEPAEDGRVRWRVPAGRRGELKRELARQGYPVLDLAGYRRGGRLAVELRTVTRSGAPFRLRDYQERAVELFCGEGGSGVIVLPCGAGKTIVGVAALARLQCEALILTPGVTAARQWRSELLDKTTLTERDIGVYAGEEREVRPVTIATYPILTTRSPKSEDYRHMRLFGERDWGLIIYDEVHLLPAPVFRMTADLQARRRLGLTATLVREDGREEDVFSLIGPKRFDLFWKTLETRGWIARVSCTEIRIPLDPSAAAEYASAGPRARIRIAAENPAKLRVVRELLDRHAGQPVLIIGQYLRQLRQMAAAWGVPLITGEVGHEERERLYARFRRGEEPVLIVSKVANLAVDLPDAAVAVQVSGSFGSRQEEAQRIGRIMRPKPGTNECWFYTVVTEGTKEEEYARRRQLFLAEQGYSYRIVRRPEAGADGTEAAKC
ncbi:MAG: helicase [Thermobacillus sp. ZCTH02-B1]|uniref:DNA repair helicase XPB n=1 Tax=Thermobacillus sp. ZCTH02-B1 TaxID=1858795 RepID=UPI000B573A10|nr:DNA repair helicase XPB [Thermobacillus sp. ZCTH02-B1]OUM96451.1 MAG: helicase [Thermobacillus sp. ZCTH02-B1]